MKKALISFLIITILFLINAQVFATRTEFSTDQTCYIEGIIQSVEFEESFRDPCLDDNSCPIGAYNPQHPARYHLSILLSTASCEPESAEPIPYETQFPLNTEVT